MGDMELQAAGGVWREKQEAAVPVSGERKMQRLGRGCRKEKGIARNEEEEQEI